MTWIIKATMILLFIGALGSVVEVAYIWHMRIKQWRHRRKADARIIAQAKAAEVWDKRPITLGGRALELKAWQDFKIRREPGEPDAHLRRRCMAAADNELANQTPTKKKRHDEIDAFVYACANQISDTFDIPLEILYGKSETDTKSKGESENE